MKKKPVVLLMTATITPPCDCPDLLRADPQMRMDDYANALKFYLDVPSDLCDRIVFAENSDTDLSSLQAVLNGRDKGKRVEFISFPQGNTFPPEYGKGYGEMLLLDYVMEHSKIISEEDVIWKATGRLILNNFSEIIKASPQDYDVYCDMHNEYKLLNLDHFFDPRFYSFTKAGYDNFFRPHTDHLKGSHIEHYFYKVLRDSLGGGRIVPRFKRVPMIRGFMGSSNQNYFTVKKKAQRHVQQVLRYMAPWFWL